MSALEGIVVHRETAAQQVAAGLASRILEGAFAPGERLRESAIAGELRVARNTVREAVRILQMSGLVRHEVNKGAVVISPTPERVAALYTARERLETAAAARKPRAGHLVALRDAFDRLEATASTHDALQIVDVDLAFHSAIVAFLDSSRIDAFYAELTLELRFYLMALSLEDREFEQPADLLSEHQAILVAIESGEHEAAVEQVRSHITCNAERVIEIVQSTDRRPVLSASTS